MTVKAMKHTAFAMIGFSRYTSPVLFRTRAWRPDSTRGHEAATHAGHAAFSFGRFMAARMGSREARRFRSAGARSANPFGLPPSWRVGAAIDHCTPESTMDHQSSHRSATAELRIAINPEKNQARWIGALELLIAEGVVPHDTTAPVAQKATCWVTNKTHHSLRRLKHPSNTEVFAVTTFYFGGDHRARAIKTKVSELKALIEPMSEAQNQLSQAHSRARRDHDFQEFKRKLLGHKKRGRARATTPHRSNHQSERT